MPEEDIQMIEDPNFMYRICPGMLAMAVYRFEMGLIMAPVITVVISSGAMQ